MEVWLEGGTLMMRRGRTDIDDPEPVRWDAPRLGAWDTNRGPVPTAEEAAGLADAEARYRYAQIQYLHQLSSGNGADKAEALYRYTQIQSEYLRGGWRRVRDPALEADVDGEPCEPELDRALRADPHDRATAAVYADWLQQRGHPRGALIALQQQAELAREAELAHEAELVREAELLLQREAPVLLGPLAVGPDFELEWAGGFIRAARISDHRGWVDAEQMLWELLRHPSARFLRALELQSFAPNVAGIRCLLMDLLLLHPPPRPPLSRLVLKLNMWNVDLRGVDEAYPDLQELVAGPWRIEIDELKLPRIRRLVLDASLSLAALAAITGGTWLDLVELDLKLSVGRAYGGDGSYGLRGSQCTAADLQALLDGTVPLPRLRVLRLRAAPFADELCSLLVCSPLAPNLELLDLSGGDLTDRGAAQLIAARETFARLRQVVVEDCSLSDAAQAGLRELCAARP